jgi:Putative beta-barrel porin 2
MNKIVTSVGLAALSAASVRAQFAPGLTPLETSKLWSVSAEVRGFYDDNYLTLPKSFPAASGPGEGHPLSSWGTEFTPSVAVNHSVENTLVTASYVYDLKWYEHKSDLDQSHQFNAYLDHEFSERYNLKLNESFVVAQEPTVIDPTIVSTPLRVSGNNVRNTGSIGLTDSLTKNFDLQVGYVNTVYAYSETADKTTGWGLNQIAGTEGAGGYDPLASRSALLDRMEQLATLDLRWKATPETTGVLGYQFGHTGYTAPEYIIFPTTPFGIYNGPPGSVGYKSNSRNADSHFVFVGADESFTPDLNGSIRVGGEYLDYYNYHTSRLSPYVDASLTYQYLQGCAAQLGVKHVHNATDVGGEFGTTPVLDEESTAVYVSDSHKLTDRLTASVMGQAQISDYVGGGPLFDGKSEQFYIVQLNVAYHFNPWLLGEAGYNYSKLNSDLAFREYTRNVVYLGIKATY